MKKARTHNKGSYAIGVSVSSRTYSSREVSVSGDREVATQSPPAHSLDRWWQV